MEHKLIGIEQTTDNKYLNIYKLKYVGYQYEIVSRHSFAELEVLKSYEAKATAVEVFPYIKWGDTYKVVMIKEFRPTINNYVYSFPAGLIEEGEDECMAAVREVHEEIGGTLHNDPYDFNQLAFCAYPNIGMSDEHLVYMIEEVVLTDKPNLQGHEDIEVVLIELDQISKFLDEHAIELTTSAWLGLSLLCNKFKIDMFKELTF